jgi:hypothetical protein
LHKKEYEEVLSNAAREDKTEAKRLAEKSARKGAQSVKKLKLQEESEPKDLDVASQKERLKL